MTPGIESPNARKRRLYREAARVAFACDDTRFDDDAEVFLADDAGAWVQCYQWISSENVPELIAPSGSVRLARACPCPSTSPGWAGATTPTRCAGHWRPWARQSRCTWQEGR